MAAFSEAPGWHDGDETFTLRLNFKAAVTTTEAAMRSHALSVTNGRVRSAQRLTGRRDQWRVTVEPTSVHDVTVALAATTSCDDAGAVCTADGRMLSSGVTVRVKGPASSPLTATREKYFPMHDGSTPFELLVTLNWPETTTHTAMRSHVFKVTNGEVISAYRSGILNTWRFRTLPLSNNTVTIELPVTTDCAADGAVCTSDGRMLSNAIVWRITPKDPAAVDNTAPSLRRAEVDGATLMLMYFEGLDAASTPAASAFTVTVAGETRSLAADNPVAVSGRRVLLTLAEPAALGKAVTVSYTVPSDNPLQDVAGNDAAALSAKAVTNYTGVEDTTAPVVQAAVADSDYVMLTYNEALDEDSTPAASAFAVRVEGAARTLAASSPVTVGGHTVTLTLASPVAPGEAVTVSYTVPSDNPLQDAAGRDAAALNNRAVSNGPVSSQQNAVDALTAKFLNLPENHGGMAFTFELRFSEEFPISYLTLRSSAFSVMNGRVMKARRLERVRTGAGRSMSHRTARATSC